MHGTEQRDACRGQHQERPGDELTPLNRRDRLGHGLPRGEPLKIVAR